MQRLSLAVIAGLAALALAAFALIPHHAEAAQGPAKATPAPAAAKATPAPATPVPATPAPAAATPVPATTPPAGTPKSTYSSCHVDGPYIAMTFDDGPSGPNTPRLLDMLKERKIHATFFFVGQCVEEYPDIVKRIVAEGHEVANHSWSHPDLAKMGDAAVHDQIQKTHDAIVQACGVAPKIMRPPYGAFTARQRAWANATWGYKIILWDVDPLDWKVRNSEHVKAEILKQTQNGSIILSHDIHKTTVDAMPSTLDNLLSKGYKFVTVSELLAMDHPATPKPKGTPKPPAKPAAADAATTPPATPAPATPAAAAKP
ncbi:MAG: polysaccharide deacetylase family protein [Chthoniobacter sp.]|uniref:polysaccharide deacetylase family protein n=1 Tax=Chthoniobacter sp. TaxID=2510640 RepID=UPI0032A5BDAE